MRLLFSPYGRANRIQCFLILLGVAAVEFFLVQLADGARATLDQANYFALLCGVALPCAWVQMCAVLGRLRDLRWPWMIALPWLPVLVWPLWRLLPADTPEELGVGFAAYCAGTGVLLILWKGDPTTKTQTPAKPQPEKAKPAAPQQADGMYARCSNGHFYNSQLQACPYCPQAAPLTPAAPPVTPTADAPPVFDPQLLVGWLVIIEGAGRGAEYRLRGTHNRIFGSQSEIVYDPEQNSYTLVPAGPPVERNGSAVSNPVLLGPYDRIRSGGATLIFVPFCTYHRWLQGQTQGSIQGSGAGGQIPLPGRTEQKRTV